MFKNKRAQIYHDNKLRYTHSWYFIIASFFWVGRIYIAPGTLASLICYPIYFVIAYYASCVKSILISLYTIIAILTIIGYFAIRKFHNLTNAFDHKSIVIDEVIGQLLTIALSYEWLFVIVLNVFKFSYTVLDVINWTFCAAFVLFRFFDIRKPLIIGAMDRMLKKYAIGVILDDVMAAIFSSFIIWLVCLLIKVL